MVFVSALLDILRTEYISCNQNKVLFIRNRYTLAYIASQIQTKENTSLDHQTLFLERTCNSCYKIYNEPFLSFLYQQK